MCRNSQRHPSKEPHRCRHDHPKHGVARALRQQLTGPRSHQPGGLAPTQSTAKLVRSLASATRLSPTAVPPSGHPKHGVARALLEQRTGPRSHQPGGLAPTQSTAKLVRSFVSATRLSPTVVPPSGHPKHGVARALRQQLTGPRSHQPGGLAPTKSTAKLVRSFVSATLLVANRSATLRPPEARRSSCATSTTHRASKSPTRGLAPTKSTAKLVRSLASATRLSPTVAPPSGHPKHGVARALRQQLTGPRSHQPGGLAPTKSTAKLVRSFVSATLLVANRSATLRPPEARRSSCATSTTHRASKSPTRWTGANPKHGEARALFRQRDTACRQPQCHPPATQSTA